jgi:hypothetical protein
MNGGDKMNKGKILTFLLATGLMVSIIALFMISYRIHTGYNESNKKSDTSLSTAVTSVENDNNKQDIPAVKHSNTVVEPREFIDVPDIGIEVPENEVRNLPGRSINLDKAKINSYEVKTLEDGKKILIFFIGPDRYSYYMAEEFAAYIVYNDLSCRKGGSYSDKYYKKLSLEEIMDVLMGNTTLVGDYTNMTLRFFADDNKEIVDHGVNMECRTLSEITLDYYINY